MTAIYRDYDQAALDAQYDQRTLVADISPYMKRWREDSSTAMQTLPVKRGVRYAQRLETQLDLFSAPQAQGLVVYIHGGAWRMLSKDESAYPALALLPHGISFAAVNFSLVPTVDLAEQAAQCAAAVEWLYEHAQDAGAHNLCVLGHSSGAHVAALLATTDWRARGKRQALVKSAVLLSGIYDLEPVRLSARNDYLRLSERDAYALSPINRVRAGGCPAVIAWGGLELDEFQRQSTAFADAWSAVGNRCERIPHPTHNHFDMSFPFAQSGTPLHDALLKVMRHAA